LKSKKRKEKRRRKDKVVVIYNIIEYIIKDVKNLLLNVKENLT
jgi:hypothetical protein